ncbi:MAG: CDP-alcohol phosphatidyltransferase family protein [Candidatus Helarchaeota archaeon]
MSFLSIFFPIFVDVTPKTLAFDLFRIIIFFALIIATVAFFVLVILKREPVPPEKLKLTYEDYLKKWATTHDWDKPPESDEGPLKPYLKIMLFFSKQYARIGFTPNKVSILSFLLACWVFMLWLMGGPWILGTAILVVFSGTLDSIDGCLAYVTDKGSKTGAFYDHVLDKYGDIFWYAGVAYFVADNFPTFFRYMGMGNLELTQTIVVGLVIFIVIYMFQILIQEYCRARQQGLGLHITFITPGERPTRIIMYIPLGLGVGISKVLHFQYPFVFGTPFWWGIDAFFVQYWIIILFCIYMAFTIISTILLVQHGKKHLDSELSEPK